MKCKNCNDPKMEGNVFDNPAAGYALNLYLCISCGSICRDNVWDNKGIVWWHVDSNQTEQTKKKLTKEQILEEVLTFHSTPRPSVNLRRMPIEIYPSLAECYEFQKKLIQENT